MNNTFSVRFVPGDFSVTVSPGFTVHAVAARAGLTLEHPCGGGGQCGKCRVRFIEGAPPPRSTEQAVVTRDDLEQGVRLACQAVVMEPAVIELPETSVLDRPHQILADTIEAHREFEAPVLVKRCIELPKPSLEDSLPDFERLQRALGPLSVSHSLLAAIPQRLRAWNFKCTAVMSGGRLIDIEEGDTTGHCYAAVFDIGTTTLAALLINAATGEVLARTTRLNPQTQFGDDVVSRIQRTRDSADALAQLHGVVIGTVNEMLGELSEGARIDCESIYECVFAGNTTMQHLLTRLHPGALGEIPFAPATGAGLSVRATELGLRINPSAYAYVFPVISGFVGGDIVAGGIALHLDELAGPVVLLDIGTNGEILVKQGDRLLAASCAAGPAFEGARIHHGMRAAKGAIERVVITTDVELGVIGGGLAAGLCGSGLIDAAAELLRKGLLMSEGLLLSPDDLSPNTPPALRARVRDGEDGSEFILAHGHEAVNGQPIVLTQRDARELQLATAAIRSALLTLLRRIALAPEDVTRYFIAGAFGNYLRLHNAQRIGLLPAEAPLDRLSFAGNTALLGAQAALLSRTARARAEILAREAEHVELSMDPEFHMAFVEAMNFPEERYET